MKCNLITFYINIYYLLEYNLKEMKYLRENVPIETFVLCYSIKWQKRRQPKHVEMQTKSEGNEK